jgi:hypothetical protein
MANRMMGRRWVIALPLLCALSPALASAQGTYLEYRETALAVAGAVAWTEGGNTSFTGVLGMSLYGWIDPSVQVGRGHLHAQGIDVTMLGFALDIHALKPVAPDAPFQLVVSGAGWRSDPTHSDVAVPKALLAGSIGLGVYFPQLLRSPIYIVPSAGLTHIWSDARGDRGTITAGAAWLGLAFAFKTEHKSQIAVETCYVNVEGVEEISVALCLVGAPHVR